MKCFLLEPPRKSQTSRPKAFPLSSFSLILLTPHFYETLSLSRLSHHDGYPDCPLHQFSWWLLPLWSHLLRLLSWPCLWSLCCGYYKRFRQYSFPPSSFSHNSWQKSLKVSLALTFLLGFSLAGLVVGCSLHGLQALPLLNSPLGPNPDLTLQLLPTAPQPPLLGFFFWNASHICSFHSPPPIYSPLCLLHL